LRLRVLPILGSTKADRSGTSTGAGNADANDEEKSGEFPVEEILPFAGGGSFPVQYEVSVGDCDYYVRYRGSWLTIEKNHEQVFEQCLNQAAEDDGEWCNEETTVYLYLISQAIRSGDFDTLTLPDKEQAKSHPLYRPGPQPVYVFLNCTEDHEHDLARCPVVYRSPLDLAKAREERAARNPPIRHLERLLSWLFR